MHSYLINQANKAFYEYIMPDSLYDVWNGLVIENFLHRRAKQFAEGLCSVLTYMYAKKLIMYETLLEIEAVLRLKEPWRYMVENPDKSVSVYISGNLYDTFMPGEVLLWIFDKIRKDERLVRLYGEMDFVGIKTRFEGLLVPDEWHEVYSSIKNLSNPIFGDKDFYWTDRNSDGSYSIFRVEYNPELNKRVCLSEGVLVFEASDGKVEYCEKQHYLYSGVHKRTAIYCYDAAELRGKMLPEASLIKTTEAGSMWYMPYKLFGLVKKLL